MQFVNTVGSSVSLRHKDKLDRLQSAMTDLQITIRGITLMDPQNTRQFSQSVESLARSSGLFLRKAVIGDKGKRRTRLLDDEICQSIGLRFGRLQRPIGAGETFEMIVLDMKSGFLKVVPIDEMAKSHGGPWLVPMGPQRFTISVEWPLPGTQGWTGKPTVSKPWQMRPSKLFDTRSTSALDCDQWLSQQLVMVNNNGVSLGEVIKLVANTESVHAPQISRMMTSDPSKEPHVHKNLATKILSGLRFAGICYHHIVVIESALFLYESLCDNKAVKRPEGDRFIPILCLVPDVSSQKKWMTFDGGLAITFSKEGQTVSYRIRPTR